MFLFFWKENLTSLWLQIDGICNMKRRTYECLYIYAFEGSEVRKVLEWDVFKERTTRILMFWGSTIVLKFHLNNWLEMRFGIDRKPIGCEPRFCSESIWLQSGQNLEFTANNECKSVLSKTDCTIWCFAYSIKSTANGS